MSLSKYEKTKSKRERNFQQKLIATVSAAQEAPAHGGPIRRFFRRALKIVNSGSFLALAGISISFVVFYHRTYVTCVSDSRELYSDYVSLKMELVYRQSDIANSIYNAASIKDLRQSLSQNKSFNHQYKDYSTLELQTRQAIQATSIDTSGIGSNAASMMLEKLDQYRKYKSLFINGILDEKTNESELPLLKALALTVTQVNAINFFQDLRTIAQIQCIPANIFSLMWGDRPITIQKYDPGSFVAAEQIHEEIDAGRNHLAPKTAPAPFPETTFRPNQSNAPPEGGK